MFIKCAFYTNFNVPFSYLTSCLDCRHISISLMLVSSLNVICVMAGLVPIMPLLDNVDSYSMSWCCVCLLGFLPTFGPCWVNLYGATRYYQLLTSQTHLNDGLGQGVSFRGRLLIAIKMEILESMESGPATVDVENALPISEVKSVSF